MNDYDYQVNSNLQHPNLVVLEPSGQQEERTDITTYILKCSDNETVSEIELESDSAMRDTNMLISSCCILIYLPSGFLIELFTTLSEIWNCNEGLELLPWNDKLTFLDWYMKEMTSYNKEDCGIINNTENLQKHLEEHKVAGKLNKKMSGKILQQISSQKKQTRQKVDKSSNQHMVKSNAKRFTYRYLN